MFNSTARRAKFIRFHDQTEMSRHKLFLGNSESPFDSSPERENIHINTPSTNKSVKKIQLDHNTSGPSSSKDCHPAFTIDCSILGADSKTTNKHEDVPVIRKNSISEERNLNHGDSSAEDDFDSDKMEIDFFSKFSQKLPYTREEDEFILKYVLKGQNIFKVGSILLWKCLESKKDNPKRTFHSLKNRFMRNIKPNLFTTYRHFITNRDTLDNILVKFPELKKQMGVKDILSKINFTTRSSPHKAMKTRSQASREHQENIKRTPSVNALESNDVLGLIVQPSQESSQPHLPDNASFQRKVNFGKKSIFVSVTLTNEDHPEPSASSVMKINERFKKLRKKKEGRFCPSCGRYNRHLREGDTSESDKESDVMIPNSVDEDEKSLKNFRKKNLNNNNHGTNHKISAAGASCSKDSPSLLSYDGELIELDMSDQDVYNDSSKAINHPKASISKKKAVKAENAAKEIQVRKRSDPGTEKQWESDSEIDIIYESAMAGFRKLIDADEEKMLFRKCLYKNRDSIGFNSDLEKNVDSYFLESSSEAKTPTLTENYSTLPPNESGKVESEYGAGTSHLASNMMKMLGKEKFRNKKS